ncbi:MAG: hypothetical protein AAF533_11605 [Acidobacteriota bacterium]
MRRTVLSLFVTALMVAMPASADELVIDFAVDLTGDGFNGAFEISPFNPTSALGMGTALNPDLIRGDAQFIVKNFDPSFTGTYTFCEVEGQSDPGVEFLLHTPLLERVEAFTTRIGSNSPQGFSEDTKILFPRTASSTTTDELGTTTTGFFGTAALFVRCGVPVSFTYTQGAETLASFDFVFNPNSLESLTIQADRFLPVATYDLDTPGAADDAPYGLNSDLNGNPGSTVLQSTRGIVQAELDAPFAGGGIGNLLDGKESSGGMPLDFDPLDGTGTLYHYTATGGELSVDVISPPFSVEIDIAPRSDWNLIWGPRVRVAILGSASFLAENVVPESLTFGPDGATPCGVDAGPADDCIDRGSDHGHHGHDWRDRRRCGRAPFLRDVNGDGFADLVVTFRTRETGLTASDSEACLNGNIVGGTEIDGCDSVTVWR